VLILYSFILNCNEGVAKKIHKKIKKISHLEKAQQQKAKQENLSSSLERNVVD